MVRLLKDLETEPRFIILEQLDAPLSDTSNADIKKLSKSLEKQQFVLPVACLTEKEGKFKLLSGAPILEAAKLAGLGRIWVYLIQEINPDPSIIAQFNIQAKLNQVVSSQQNIQEFIDFLNRATESELIKRISGVGKQYAKLIHSQRPFQSREDLKKLGPKRSLQWLQAYGQSSNS